MSSFGEAQSVKKYQRVFDFLILGNWNAFKPAEDFDLFFSKVIGKNHLHLALPYGLVSKYLEKGVASDIVIGCNAMSSALKGSYTEGVGVKILSKKNIPFVLLDLKETGLISEDPLKEINEKIKCLLNHEISVFVVLGENYSQFLDGNFSDIIINQIRAIVENVPESQLNKLSFIYSSAGVSAKGIRGLKMTIDGSTVFFRQALESVLGSDASLKVRVMMAVPSISTDYAKLIHNTIADGFYFSNVAIYPESFLQTIQPSALSRG